MRRRRREEDAGGRRRMEEGIYIYRKTTVLVMEGKGNGAYVV